MRTDWHFILGDSNELTKLLCIWFPHQLRRSIKRRIEQNGNDDHYANRR